MTYQQQHATLEPLADLEFLIKDGSFGFHTLSQMENATATSIKSKLAGILR